MRPSLGVAALLIAQNEVTRDQREYASTHLALIAMVRTVNWLSQTFDNVIPKPSGCDCCHG